MVKGTKASVSLFLSTSRQDRLSPASSIEQFVAAAAGTPVQIRTQLLSSGGHNYNTWKQEYPAGFTLLSQWLRAPR